MSDAPYWRDLPIEQRARMWWDERPIGSDEGDGPCECAAACPLPPFAVARVDGETQNRSGHRDRWTPCRNRTAQGSDRCAAHGGPRKNPQRTKPTKRHVPTRNHSDIGELSLRDALRVALWFRDGGADAFDDFTTPDWLDEWARSAASTR